MNPVAFNLFGLDIRWYGIIIASGMALAGALAMLEAKRVGYKTDDILDLLLWAIPTAIIGARLYYVAFSWDYFSVHTNEILAIRNGGLAIHGAIIASFVTSYLFVRVKKLNFFKLADIAAPSLILGQAIGRWGNFMNQEAHGGIVSESFISHFPSFIKNQMFINGHYYHPTFLYESAWDFMVFAFLIFFRYKKKREGELIALYLALYSTGRFFIEGLRTDSLMFGPIRVAQLISLAFGLAGFFLFLVLRHKRQINNKKGY